MRFAYRGVRDMGAPGVSMAPCRHAVPSVRMCREQEEDSIWPRHAGPLLSKLLRKAERMRAAVAAEAEGDGGGGQEMPAGRPSSTVQGTNTWSRLTAGQKEKVWACAWWLRGVGAYAMEPHA
eukprot:524825-Pelagomonas_calceolata.AAC.4